MLKKKNHKWPGNIYIRMIIEIKSSFLVFAMYVPKVCRNT